MGFDIVGVVVAGISATVIMTGVLLALPRVGLPAVDIVRLIGTTFSSEENRFLGWIIHLMMGMFFALVYIWLWSLNVRIANSLWLTGLGLGLVHWIVAGLLLGFLPLFHAGIKAGTVKAPGLYLTAIDGLQGFLSGLIGHLVFGLLVGLVFMFFA